MPLDFVRNDADLMCVFHQQSVPNAPKNAGELQVSAICVT